jgi:hypothetical protein
MEDIRNRRRPLYVLCIKFKYLGSYFVPELNDTADITERISQARKLFGSMNKYWATKDTDRYPSQALSSDCCEYSTLGSSWALKEADRSKLEAFHHGCLRNVRADDVGCSRENGSNEHVRGMVANSPWTR